MKETLPVILFILIVLAFCLHNVALSSFTVVAIATYIGYNQEGYNQEKEGVAGAIVAAFFALLGVAAYLLLDHDWS